MGMLAGVKQLLTRVVTTLRRYATMEVRQLNSCSQVYGFVRFLNVRNKDKLAQALNNVWIGDLSVWAPEARFDRFAQYDVENRVPIRGGKGVENGGEMRPVVITHGEGVKNVRVSKEKEEVKKSRGRKKMVTIGKVEVNVGKKTKKNNKLKNKSVGGVEGASVKVKEAVEEGKKVLEPKLKMVEKKNIAQTGEMLPRECYYIIQDRRTVGGLMVV